ncbi:MAG: ACT domain-containing protein [Candidatus Anstonellales archaeon]
MLKITESMVTVAHIVEKLVKENPSLEQALAMDLLSYSRTAVYLKPKVEKELGKEVKIGAIAMALQRIAEKVRTKAKEHEYKIKEISTRSNLAEISIAKTSRIKEIIDEVYETVDIAKGDVVNFIHGNNETTIIFSDGKFEEIKEILRKEKVIGEMKGLGAISLRFSEETLSSPGFVAYVLKELAWHGINVVEVVSTYTELSVILKEEDVGKAYNVIKSLFK